MNGKLTLPDGIEIGEFKPCQIIYKDSGITEYIFEDVAYLATPVVPGVYHTVDWLLALDNQRLVGIQFWTVHPTLGRAALKQGEPM